LEALPNHTPADESIIQDLLNALKGGNEHAQQRGTLMAFIAQCQTAYTRLHGIQSKPFPCTGPSTVSYSSAYNHLNIDSTRLSSQSRIINLEKHGLYQDVLQFCIRTWPNAGIFGPGMVETHYLAPVGMVRNHSYVEFDGIRYGAFEHTSGKGYCYGYIDGRYPVRIERILHIVFPGEAGLRTICVFVRPFQAPPVEAEFPWDTW
jgi:hypothetical protein